MLKASSSVLKTWFNYLISSFSPGSEHGVCVGSGEGGGGTGARYVHLYEHTMNSSPQNCTFITVSHIFHLMVTGWVSRSRCAERIWGARCFSGINPCEGQGKKADLGREELNREEGLAKPQSGSRESGTQVITKSWGSGAFVHSTCLLTRMRPPRKGITPKEATLQLSRPWRSTVPSTGT